MRPVALDLQISTLTNFRIIRLGRCSRLRFSQIKMSQTAYLLTFQFLIWPIILRSEDLITMTLKGAGISAGVNADGLLNLPETRWGGIMRKIESTNFDATNVEYIEFWLMDPFVKGADNSGELYFNLGDISEDILRDGRKSFEHGLPPTEEVENVDTTIWGGRVPSFQALVDNFSNVPGSRAFQDVGLDGLRTEDERSFFSNAIYRTSCSFVWFRIGSLQTGYIRPFF